MLGRTWDPATWTRWSHSLVQVPERGHKHSPHSGTSARMGTSAEMGVEVVQRSLSSSGTGRLVPERGASHDPVLELGLIFDPSSGTGTNSPSSGTGTVSAWGPTVTNPFIT